MIFFCEIGISMPAPRKLIAPVAKMTESEIKTHKATILMYAKNKQWQDLIDHLNDSGLSCTSFDDDNAIHLGSALLFAVCDKQLEATKYLLAAGAGMNWGVTSTVENSLHSAILYSDADLSLQMVNLLLGANKNSSYKAMLNYKNNKGMTPIELAASEGRWDIVAKIATALEDACVEVSSSCLSTVVYKAIEADQIQLAKKLITKLTSKFHGQWIDTGSVLIPVTNQEVCTGDFLASNILNVIKTNQSKVLSFLLAHYPELKNIKTPGRQYSLLHYAVEHNQSGIIEELLTLNCEDNKKDKNGYTAFELALIKGRYDCASKLKGAQTIERKCYETVLNSTSKKVRLSAFEYLTTLANEPNNTNAQQLLADIYRARKAPGWKWFFFSQKTEAKNWYGKLEPTQRSINITQPKNKDHLLFKLEEAFRAVLESDSTRSAKAIKLIEEHSQENSKSAIKAEATVFRGIIWKDKFYYNKALNGSRDDARKAVLLARKIMSEYESNEISVASDVQKDIKVMEVAGTKGYEAHPQLKHKSASMPISTIKLSSKSVEVISKNLQQNIVLMPAPVKVGDVAEVKKQTPVLVEKQAYMPQAIKVVPADYQSPEQQPNNTVILTNTTSAAKGFAKQIAEQHEKVFVDDNNSGEYLNKVIHKLSEKMNEVSGKRKTLTEVVTKFEEARIQMEAAGKDSMEQHLKASDFSFERINIQNAQSELNSAINLAQRALNLFEKASQKYNGCNVPVRGIANMQEKLKEASDLVELVNTSISDLHSNTISKEEQSNVDNSSSNRILIPGL